MPCCEAAEPERGSWLLWPAPADKVSQAAALGCELIGAAHPDEGRLTSRLKVDPATLAVALDSDQRVVALTIVYGLSLGAVGRLASGVIVAGSALQPFDLVPSDAAGLYLAMVGGVTGHRVTALRLLVGHLGRLLLRHQAASDVFARAASGAGQRLLAGAGFAPIIGSSELLSARADAFRAAFQNKNIEGWPDRREIADIHRQLSRHRGGFAESAGSGPFRYGFRASTKDRKAAERSL